ncbi:MAG: hypothetical protein MJ016_06585 [Victivallaceae bacterium]|nr:hypothetical protein [Victivallaceae bacterium]
MKKHPFSWLFSLYFVEGAPAAIICEVAVVLFAALGYPPETIAKYVSILGMPWMIKPLWAFIVDGYATKKKWIIAMQLLLGAVFLGAAAYAMPGKGKVLFYILLAGSFFSATHDIAADGFFLVALDDHSQALYSGWRSVFYRIAMIAANGGLLLFVAHFSGAAHLSPWQGAFILAAVGFFTFGVWHAFALPDDSAASVGKRSEFSRRVKEFLDSLHSFVKIPHLAVFLCFLLFYRFAEAQLTFMSKIFLLDGKGGGLSLEMYSSAVGIFGIAAMLAGGVAGGIAAARFGLKKMLFPMALLLNVPDLLYLLWAFRPIEGNVLQTFVIAVEQFGYGFGFTGYMLLMLYLAGLCGKFKTTVFSYLTCVMIFGLRIPGFFSGDLFALMKNSYRWFFLWVTAATLISFAVTIWAAHHLPEKFGKRDAA